MNTIPEVVEWNCTRSPWFASFSRLAQGDRIAIRIEGGHTDAEGISFRFRLEKLHATSFQSSEVLAKIIRLDEECANAGRGFGRSRTAEPKQDFECLVLEGDCE